MTFESMPKPGPTPEQVKAAEEKLKGSSLERVGLMSEESAQESKTVMEAIGGEYNPYEKKGSTGLYPEGEKGERMISDEEAEEAAKRIKGSEAEKWELI